MNERVTGAVPFVYHGGGRAHAAFKGHVGACAARAIAIANGLPDCRVIR
jgi:hypothetical protein